MRDKQINIRLSTEERDAFLEIASEMGMKLPEWMRMMALDAIQRRDRFQEVLVSRLDAVDSRLASLDALCRGSAKLSDGAYSMACASVGLLASRNLDAIDGSDATSFRDRLRENMRVGVGIGEQLRANLDAGKQV